MVVVCVPGWDEMERMGRGCQILTALVLERGVL